MSVFVEAYQLFKRVSNGMHSAKFFQKKHKLIPIEQQLQLASYFEKMGEVNKARAVFENIVEIKPNCAEALFGLGRIHVREGALWAGFLSIKKSYEISNSSEAAYELQTLVGTTTPWHEVKDAISSQFDREFYLAQNSDVKQSAGDPEIHYLLYGWKEDRNPSKLFDSLIYRKKYRRDLKANEFPLARFAAAVKMDKVLSPSSAFGSWFSPTIPSIDEWKVLTPAITGEATRAVVIIPVYRGALETLSAIFSALESRGTQNYSLLVVNDCSPDNQLNMHLLEISKHGLFDYVVNTKNMGFVKTVNMALSSHSRELDVVLLNADAYVFPGWFDRLIAHAEVDEKAATVTPLSNNATLCSYPLVDHNNMVALECTPAQLDQLASVANAGISYEAPTGVGFCLYMRRAIIDEIGLLDSLAFKVGYGEENDFCMRALQKGYKNLIAADVFVYHIGAISFLGEKSQNFIDGQRALLLKHPNYGSLINRHYLADPGGFVRLRLDAARLVSELRGCVTIFTHKWGGGIETYIQGLTRQLEADGKRYVIFRFSDEYNLTIEAEHPSQLYIPNLDEIDLRTEWNVFERLLIALEPSLVHVNSFAGLNWQCHKAIIEMLSSGQIPYCYIGHDYSAISHSYHLLRPDYVFSGSMDLCERRKWSTYSFAGISDLSDPDERIRTYKKFLESADTVVVPSQSAKRILKTEFPTVDVQVIPHTTTAEALPRAERREFDKRIRIAVLGAIGPHKGSDVLFALALDTAQRNLNIDYFLVGYSDRNDSLIANGVKVLGPYGSEKEAADIILEIKPDLIFIPSIWPETFCYTLSTALAMSLPTIVFDLGAQAERLRNVNFGVVVPTSFISNPQALNDLLAGLDMDALWQATAD